ncbi:TetR family transcriptional regulator [Spongiactinospora gelatinilytica]|uniref:TetR family transcriptional regulator n=1 Tax=Spongiactinospora gelatinilytica TaxID=2666298 RepID=A0A2W2I7C7_9ACTN|nr:TetR family transcriptional regulator [Spongiactinospora gelatinilytica]
MNKVTTLDRSRPRRGRPGYNRESLLQVAVQVFNERGYDGTSMDDLSKKLGISKAAIYHHVSSKDELLELGVNRALDGLFAAAADATAAEVPAIDRLAQLIRASVTVLVERLPYVTLLLRVRGNTEVEQRALDRRRQFDRLVAGLVAEAKADGDIRPDVDPAVAGRLLFGMVNSVVEWYRPNEATSAAELAEAIRTMAFDGFRR